MPQYSLSLMVCLLLNLCDRSDITISVIAVLSTRTPIGHFTIPKLLRWGRSNSKTSTTVAWNKISEKQKKVNILRSSRNGRNPRSHVIKHTSHTVTMQACIGWFPPDNVGLDEDIDEESNAFVLALRRVAGFGPMATHGCPNLGNVLSPTSLKAVHATTD